MKDYIWNNNYYKKINKKQKIKQLKDQQNNDKMKTTWVEKQLYGYFQQQTREVSCQKI